MSNRITIITVCFNRAATIGDTLESVASQDFKEFEHLIIDGGSTDGTLEIIRAWHKHPVRLISEPDEGIYDAMNKGLRLATGDVIGFLNADDFYANSSVLGQIAKPFGDAAVDACYADLVYVSQDSKRTIRYWKSSEFVPGSFALGWCPPHPTFYVRREVVNRLGDFDRSFRLGADIEFMMRYLERGGVRPRYVPHVWVCMRIGGESNQSIGNIIRQNRYILEAMKKNNISFSLPRFAFNKIVDRAGQFVSGFIRRYQ